MAIDTAGFALWNKLVRRTLVTENDLLPTEGIDFWEDLSVSCRAIALARSISTTDTPVYYYCHDQLNPSMTMNGHTETITHDRLVYALLMEKWFVHRGLAELHRLSRLDEIRRQDQTVAASAPRTVAMEKHLSRGKRQDMARQRHQSA